MKKFIGLLTFLLLASFAFAAFDDGHFNFGRQWKSGYDENTSFADMGLSHLAIWVGDNNAYNSYWEGAMVRACKKNGLTPVFYAYVIAEYDKDQGYVDCDMGNPNHCTNGANTIRHHWTDIISRYSAYAQGVAKDFKQDNGTVGTTIWLIEPDFFQYSFSGDTLDKRFEQQDGGIPDDSLAGYYFNSIVSTIKAALPNAKIAVDISPWLNDGIRTWYNRFDKSKVDYLFTSGGRTQGNQTRIRNDDNNLVTWAGARSAMGGKMIIADDGYGVGGAGNNDYTEWLDMDNLGARIQDGVLGLTIQDPDDSYYKFAKSHNITITHSGASSSSQSSSSMSSSSMSSSSSAPSSSSEKVLTVFELTSGNATQTVTAGDEISPIVYRYEKISSIRANIISGLDAVKDESAKTYTISGRIPENTAPGEHKIQLGVLGPDTNFTVNATINVNRKPVVTTVELISGNAEQTVTAGDDITPIVFRYANVKSYTVEGMPAGLAMSRDENAQTITISGTIQADLGDMEKTVTVNATGPDNNASASAKIVIKHKPARITYEIKSGSTSQTVTAGNAIEPIVYSYQNVKNFKLSGVPKGLSGTLDKSAKTYTISGTVLETLTDHEYEYTITMTGIDNDSTAKGKITVKHKPAETVFELTSGNANQTIVAGNAIEPIVYRYEHATRVSLSGVPQGLTGTLDQSAKTYTISGTVDSSVVAKAYTFTVDVTGVDNNTSVTGTITVVQSSSSVESSSSEESSSSAEVSSSSIEVSSSSVIPASSSDIESSSSEEKSSSSDVSSSSSVESSSSEAPSSSSEESSSSEALSSSSVESSSSVKVQMVFQLTSGKPDQTVTAGNSINSIVYSIKNVTEVSVTGLPAGLMGAINKSNTTFMISGTVADTLKDNEYVYTIDVTGVDSSTTATGKITVKHKPVTTVLELVTGNSSQTVTAGNAIEPIVYRYENMRQIELSGIPAGLKGTKDDNAKTYTISGIVADSLTDYVYDYTIAVTGIDNNTSATGKITVLHSSSSVASSSSVLESSSSEESSSSIQESSSSEIIVVESSSSEIIIVESSSGESSSSSEIVIVESSSSALPESSSSEPPSSSSENTQVVVSGSLEQTVARGEAFETITFSNVQTFDRKSWNLWFVEFKQVGDVVTVEGSVHKDFPTGTSVETVMVNGQKFVITFVVTMPESSSSSAIPASSSDIASSSSKEQSSSSGTPATSSSTSPETSSSDGSVLVMSPAVSRLSLVVAGRMLHVSGASDIAVEIFDMKGTPIATFGHVSGAVSLDMLRQGSFVVRLRSGSDTLIRRIVVK